VPVEALQSSSTALVGAVDEFIVTLPPERLTDTLLPAVIVSTNRASTAVIESLCTDKGVKVPVDTPIAVTVAVEGQYLESNTISSFWVINSL
jgi:hypothetical protein